MIHPSGDVLWVIVKSDLKLRRGVYSGDINWVTAHRLYLKP